MVRSRARALVQGWFGCVAPAKQDVGCLVVSVGKGCADCKASRNNKSTAGNRSGCRVRGRAAVRLMPTSK